MQRSVSRLVSSALIIVGAAACASSGSQPPATAAAQTSSASGSRSVANMITSEELKANESLQLQEIIQRLHPDWLRRSENRGRGTAASSRSTSSALSVYVNNNRIGAVDALNQIDVHSVASVRYFSASEAQTRFGNGNMGGAIQVITVGAAVKP